MAAFAASIHPMVHGIWVTKNRSFSNACDFSAIMLFYPNYSVRKCPIVMTYRIHVHVARNLEGF